MWEGKKCFWLSEYNTRGNLADHADTNVVGTIALRAMSLSPSHNKPECGYSFTLYVPSRLIIDQYPDTCVTSLWYFSNPPSQPIHACSSILIRLSLSGPKQALCRSTISYAVYSLLWAIQHGTDTAIGDYLSLMMPKRSRRSHDRA